MGTGSVDFAAYYEEHAATSEALSTSSLEWYDVYQRVLDIILSVVGIVVGLPFVLIFAIAVKLETPGPAFYTQERVGKHGRLFR